MLTLNKLLTNNQKGVDIHFKALNDLAHYYGLTFPEFPITQGVEYSEGKRVIFEEGLVDVYRNQDGYYRIV